MLLLMMMMMIVTKRAPRANVSVRAFTPTSQKKGFRRAEINNKNNKTREQKKKKEMVMPIVMPTGVLLPKRTPLLREQHVALSSSSSNSSRISRSFDTAICAIAVTGYSAVQSRGATPRR